jgi:hypothetical protein
VAFYEDDGKNNVESILKHVDVERRARVFVCIEATQAEEKQESAEGEGRCDSLIKRQGEPGLCFGRGFFVSISRYVQPVDATTVF